MFSGYDQQNLGTQFGTQSPSVPRKTANRGHQFCTIRHLVSASESSAENVEILGFIEHVQQQEATLKYRVNDWSGASLEVSKYTTSGESLPPVLPVNSLVHVIGTVRHFGAEVSMTCHLIAPVLSGDQSTRHLVGLAFTKIQLTPSDPLASLPALSAGPVGAFGGFAADFTAEELLRTLQKGARERGEFTVHQAWAVVQARGVSLEKVQTLLDELCRDSHMWVDKMNGDNRYVFY